MVTSGFVYFVHDETANAIKIGWSKDPLDRITALQVANPTKLRLVAVVPGHKALEEAAHARWKDLQIHGEWFRAEFVLVEWILGLGDTISIPGSPGVVGIDFLPLDAMIDSHIVRVLHACGGNKSEAARHLRIDRRSLYRRLANMGVAA